MSQHMRNGPGPVPERWLHCPRKSESVIGQHFLAFKTPLSSAFNDQVPLECLFMPEMVFGYCKTLKLELGLWIDLTNTKRFYDRGVVESHGVNYVKLQCRGHGETPSPEQTQAFIEIVANYLNERPFGIIGVHCTHGFNRTGFLIVSYLVERLDFALDAALATFSNARPPGIYKQDYINELYRRYDDEEDAPQAPALPEWCLDYDDSTGERDSSATKKRKLYETQAGSTSQLSNRDDSNEDDQDNGGENETSNSNGDRPRKKRRKEMIVKNATFMYDIPGVTLLTEQPLLGILQLKVQQMCNWEQSGFPGAQPVSMDTNNVQLLQRKPYRVSWKADGVRYMMLIVKRDEIYFFDRNLSCFQVENLTFLKAGDLNTHLTDTLLDGEMVLDKINQETIPRYLIYDIVSYCGNNVGNLKFYPDRLNIIKMKIIDPRFEAITRGIINRPLEPFSVRNKEFWEIRQSASLLSEKFAKALPHEPDGLIFQPSLEPYKAGVCPEVLKWKPFEMNSVDFRLKIEIENGVGIVRRKVGNLYVGGSDLPFGVMKWTNTLQELNNKIIECTRNKTGHWEFLRQRTDKTHPNSFSTANAVLKSIKNPVTKESLIDFIFKYGYRDDKDKMPPPPPQQYNRQQHLQHLSQQHHSTHYQQIPHQSQQKMQNSQPPPRQH